MSHRTRSVAILDAHVILVRASQVLLLRRAGTGYEDGKFGLIAGHVEALETFDQAAAREALEETAVTITPDHLRLAHVMHHYSAGQRVAAFFLASAWSGVPVNAEPGKCDAVAWFDLAGLPSNMIEYQRLGLLRALAEQPYSAHGWP